MKASIKTERIYTITANGVTKNGWREVSQWNGLVELERHGEKIIAITGAQDSILGPFADLFGLSGDCDLTPIKASPGAAKWLQGEQETEGGEA